MSVISIPASVLSGFLFGHFISHENSRINKKLPFVKIKFLQVSPHIKLHLRTRTIHVHHWLSFSIILIITLTCSVGFLESAISRSFLIGGILQGLSFDDWKKVVIRK